VLLKKAFRTYPKGFPVPLLDEFAKRTDAAAGQQSGVRDRDRHQLGAEHHERQVDRLYFRDSFFRSRA